ncbi:MAG: toll/interleukin-1 receptor domain-containing protein [Dehalococcoidia bacterium]|nr:toll/interleukin-1 receptor domain-containing protein [Dehalococcoidia bacterium]
MTYEKKLRIFISYAGDDGKDCARRAKEFFRSSRHDPYLWPHDNNPVDRVWKQISEQIAFSTDLMFFICTKGSSFSYGQQMEIEYAIKHKKPIVVASLDRAPVLVVLGPFVRLDWSAAEFDARCLEFARKLPEYVSRASAIQPAESEAKGLEAEDRRTRYIQELSANVGQLDGGRVEKYKGTILQSYLEATRLRYLVPVTQVLSRMEALGFERIELWALIKLQDFNDPKFAWDGYFRGVGRWIAGQELRYLHEAIIQQVGQSSPNTKVLSRSHPEFQVLVDYIQELEHLKLTPDRLLAPVEMMVPFYKFFEYSSEGRVEYFQIGRSRLAVSWSHESAPLDRFILFDHQACIWKVLPDSNSGTAITIALGQSKLYPDKVGYGVETCVKCEITRPEAFRTLLTSQ